MNLYELTATAAQLQALLEEGDIDEQIFADSLEALMIDEKVESVCMVIRNLEAQASVFKEEEQRLAKKRTTAENGVKRLKESLQNLMETTNRKKLTAGLFTLSLGTSAGSVKLLDEAALPACYLTPQPPKVDRTAIAAAIRAGQEVPGAALEKSSYVKIK